MYFSAVLTHPFSLPSFIELFTSLPDDCQTLEMSHPFFLPAFRSPFWMNVSVVGLYFSLPFLPAPTQTEQGEIRMNHSIAGSERNSILSFHSEPGWVVERTHCVVEAFPGAAFTQIDRQSSSWWRLCVCYLVLPASLTIRRFTGSLAVSFPGDRPRVAR